MQGGFRSSEQGSDQVVRTQEIHIVSSNSRHQDQKQERHQSQDNSPQFEPMMFSNTPFSVGEDGKRKGRRNQVVPAWRYSFVVCLVMVDLAVINVLAAVPMTLISGGRNSLIQLGVAAWTYWALFRRQNNRWKGMRLGFRTVLKFVAIALVGLASFKPLLSLMGRKAGDSTMYEYLSIYIGAPIKNLDAYLTNSMSPSLAVKSTQWGDMTLASTRASFPQIFGKTVLDWMQWQPFQRYGERSLGNVFTTYYAFIFDWGIAGAMLAIVLIAALSQLCYESAVFALQYGKAGIPISMMLYGAIGYCCAFSFFSNRWMSTMFNQIMLRNIIIWVVLIFFVNSVRIRKRAFAKRVVLYA